MSLSCRSSCDCMDWRNFLLLNFLLWPIQSLCLLPSDLRKTLHFLDSIISSFRRAKFILGHCFWGMQPHKLFLYFFKLFLDLYKDSRDFFPLFLASQFGQRLLFYKYVFNVLNVTKELYSKLRSFIFDILKN